VIVLEMLWIVPVRGRGCSAGTVLPPSVGWSVGALEWAARARRVVLVTWLVAVSQVSRGRWVSSNSHSTSPVRGQWLGMPRRTPRAWRVRSAVRWMSWRRSVDLRVRA